MTTPMDRNSNTQTAIDSYLVVLAQDGDQKALTELLRRWHSRFLRLAYRLSGDKTLAQDIVQDATIKIIHNLHYLKDPEAFPAWSYKIVRRKSLDYFRKQSRHPKTTSLDTQEAQIQTSHRPSSDYDLRQALEKLSKADRLLLSLFYLDGYNGRELSAAFNIPIGTVKSRLFKAREHLKSIYETNQGD